MDIYCGNLSFDVDNEKLRAAFEPFGTVESAQVVTDKYSGKSRGFGFVKMLDNTEARAAISKLDGLALEGRNIKVSEGRPQRDFGTRD